jgi:hypothetical protein
MQSLEEFAALSVPGRGRQAIASLLDRNRNATIPSNKAHGGTEAGSVGLFYSGESMKDSPQAPLTLSMKGRVGKTTSAIAWPGP